MIGMVHFSNPGEIDPRMWSTFGVSVKENDNAIGQFGTGLKYAIAVLMREGRSLVIRSKSNTYVFGIEQTDIRGKEFAQITCNGEPLPFTTHLGAKWELWQAYREIFSNCLDEGGSLGEGGDTVISAELADVRHDDVFLQKDRSLILASSFHCDVYPGQSYYIYRRGIRAMELETPSMFTYDLQTADLTEDRTLKYNWEIGYGIGNTVMESDDPSFITDFLTQTKGYFEERLSLGGGANPSKAVREVVSQFRRESVYLQNSLMEKVLPTLGAQRFDFKAMNAHQQEVVRRACEFCERIGYSVDYPIKLAADLGGGTLALADRKTQQIYLSERVLTQGLKQVASTVLEENLHLKERLDDNTYEMQSYLFDQIITMGEKLTGEVL